VDIWSKAKNRIKKTFSTGRTFHLHTNWSIAFIKVSKFTDLMILKPKQLRSRKLKINWELRDYVTTLKTLIWTQLRSKKYTIRLLYAILYSPFTNPLTLIKDVFSNIHYFKLFVKTEFSLNKKQVLGEGLVFVLYLMLIFYVDALLTDDEPLWEPTEWSLIQSWLMFIFLFSWIAENLITSRYGSYTGRDKRVWFAWYKTFWNIQIYYAISLGAAALFVIIPFYHEITYITPLVISWWDWYSRTFFFKFTSIYAISLLLATYFQSTITQFHWKKSLIIALFINLFIAYLVYGHFFTTFFAYFTNSSWYLKTRLVDYVQLSHEPNKWAWGNSKRDHFSYHSSKTVFWYKNDGPFASAMLLFNIFFFLTLFTFHIFWLTLIRRIYATNEVTYTYATYCVSALRQFLYCFNLLYLLIWFSFAVTYWRLPIEFYWLNILSEMFMQL
jgi:hypothetical protein